MSQSAYRSIELERVRREQLRIENVRQLATSLCAACQKTITAIKEPAVQQLAAEGLRKIMPELKQASLLIAVDPDRALDRIEATQRQLHTVLAKARAQARKWSREQAAAQARLDEAKERLAAAKEAAGPAQAGLFANAEQQIAQAESLQASGRHRESEGACKKADKLARQASKAGFDETVRREAVRSVIATLTSQGFVVEQPRVVDTEHAAGVVTLTGTLPSGKTARFEIQVDGTMRYDLDGYEGRTCAKEVERIEEVLHDRFAVKLGPPQVTWKEPEPIKIAKGARELPASPARRRSR